MAIRTKNHTGTDEEDRLNRKLDQAYELMRLAHLDGDNQDEIRWLEEVTKLREQLRDWRLSTS